MPKLKKAVVRELNAQLGRELASSHEYMAMAIYFSTRSLDSLAGFFFRQADEERQHALKFLRYLLEVGEKPVIPQVPKPKTSYRSMKQVAETSLKLEEKITANIAKMVTLANRERDHTTANFLAWFVEEQLEEESIFGKLVNIVKLSDNDLQVELYVHRLNPEDA